MKRAYLIRNQAASLRTVKQGRHRWSWLAKKRRYASCYRRLRPIKAQVSDPVLQAIDLDGHYLIEASAGTGKTTALCLLYLRLLFERKLLPDQILTVTFTKAATTELKARIYTKLQKIKAWVHDAHVQLDDTDPDLHDKASIKTHLAKVLQGFDRAAIYTIHGFCRKVLAEAALETGCHFSQNLIEDDKALLQPMLDDFWRKTILPDIQEQERQYAQAVHALFAAIEPCLSAQQKEDLKALQEALCRQIALFSTGLENGAKVKAIFKDCCKRIAEYLTQNDAFLDQKALQSILDDFWDEMAKNIPFDATVKKQESQAWCKELYENLTNLVFEIKKTKKTDADFLKTFKNRVIESLPATGARGSKKKSQELLEKDYLPRLQSVVEEAKSRLEAMHTQLLAAWQNMLENLPALEEDCSPILSPDDLLKPVKNLLNYPEDAIGFGDDPRSKLWQRLYHFCREESRRRHERKQELGFHDLLINVYDALVKNSNDHLAKTLGRRYRALLVDEFQDTDLLQYRIFKTLQTQIPTAFFVGDPKQAIYGFRGADIFAYLAAKRDIQESAKEHILSLTRNFRASSALMQSINAIFQQDDAFAMPGIDYVSLEAKQEGGIGLNGNPYPALTFLWLATDKDNTQDVDPKRPQNEEETPQQNGTLSKGEAKKKAIERTAWRISQLLQAGEIQTQDGKRGITPADIAILVNDHEEAKAMEKALQTLRIPAVRGKQAHVFSTREAFDLWIVLSALLKPEWPLVRAALGTSFFRFDDDLADEKLLEQKTEKFVLWQHQWQRQGFAAMFKTLMTDEQVAEQLLTASDGKRRLANLLQLVDILQEESQQGKGMEVLAAWFAEHLDPDMATDEESERFRLRAIEESHKVQIMTIHAAKGLEFPVVFCPFVWDMTPYSTNPGIVHLWHPNRNAQDDASTTIFVDSAEGEALWQERQAELMRLFYVALTRAKYACHLVVGPIQSGAKSSPLDHIGHSPLGWLLNQPEYLARNESLNAEAFKRALQKWCATLHEADGVLASFDEEATPKAQSSTPDASMQNDPVAFQPRAFSRGDKIAKTFAMTSFSALAQHRLFIEAPDYDALLPTLGEEVILPPEDFSDIAHFPKGAKTGECWHLIFEAIANGIIDPQSDNFLPYIQETLGKFALPKDWSLALSDLVRKVLAFDLQGFSLAEGMTASLAEFEFIFASSMDQQTFAKLPGLLEQHKMPEAFVKAASELSFEDFSGFLKGFIDLVFRAPNGKYYLLDYKSNWLGFGTEAYTSEHLITAMAEHHYYLQYLIYTVALYRFLQSRKRAYGDFGGVFYLFLRGMIHQQGVYFDRPCEELVQTLDEWLAPLSYKTPKNPLSVAMP